MKRFLPLIALLIGVVTLASAAQGRAAAAWTDKVAPELIAATGESAEVEFLVVLARQGDLSRVAVAPTKEAKGQSVYDTLSSLARQTQAPLLAYLRARGLAHRSYWVVNMIWVRGDRQALSDLAQLPAVARIEANGWRPMQLPDPAPATGRNRTEGAPTWNLELVKAPDVWAEGITGAGVVIGGQDTGYDWTHPALQSRYRGWNGATANHNYNWHDAIREENPLSRPGNRCGYDLAEPCDDSNHGTHTMGIMVGDDGRGQIIGMAPGAQWIGCRNMEGGWGSPATYTECFEWFIAPYPIGGDPLTDGDPARAPHVINNSWSCPPDEGCDAPDILKQVVETVRAAGIVTVQAAGNSGPDCSTIAYPASIYEASISVGATKDDDQITTFSSRGPVIVDGSNRLKPDIVAPGEDIYSSLPGEAYGLMSGTSMSAPHVAGLVALLVSARPDLAGDVDALEGFIRQSAAPIPSDEGCGGDDADDIPNNTYGWGRTDAYRAYRLSRPPILAYTIYVPLAFEWAKE